MSDRAAGWEGTPLANPHTRRRYERNRDRKLVEEMGLWVDCAVHGPRQPSDPFIDEPTCLHCADAGSLERDHVR